LFHKKSKNFTGKDMSKYRDIPKPIFDSAVIFYLSCIIPESKRGSFFMHLYLLLISLVFLIPPKILNKPNTPQKTNDNSLEN